MEVEFLAEQKKKDDNLKTFMSVHKQLEYIRQQRKNFMNASAVKAVTGTRRKTGI